MEAEQGTVEGIAWDHVVAVMKFTFLVDIDMLSRNYRALHGILWYFGTCLQLHKIAYYVHMIGRVLRCFFLRKMRAKKVREIDLMSSALKCT